MMPLKSLLPVVCAVTLTGCAETLPPAPAPPVTGFGGRLPPLPELPPYRGNGGNYTAGLAAPYVAPPSRPPPARLSRPVVTPPVMPQSNAMPMPPPLRSIEDDPPPVIAVTPHIAPLTPPADATECWGYWRICHFY
jgi:hypothetical protein